MKKQKGITLIALIITVIVMLILVGVTINVALNGGLFETTKSAVSETEKMAILEEIIEMTKWNNKGEVDVEGTKTSVEAKYPGAVWDEATGKLTIVGKQGTYEYKMTDNTIALWDDKGQPGDGGETDDKGQPGDGGETKEYKFTIGDFVNNATVDETKDEDGDTTGYYYDMSITDFCNLINIEENELKKYIVHVKSTDMNTDAEIIREDCESGGFDVNDMLLDLLMNGAGISQEDINKAGLRSAAEETKFTFQIIINGQTIKMALAEGTDASAYYKINEIPENVLNTNLKLKNSDALIKVLKDNNLTD